MTKKSKLILAVICISLLTGCGSFTTLTKDDVDIAQALKQKNTNCDSILRIYSGVNFDGCLFNANSDAATTSDTVLYFWLFDMAGSAVVDTVALPYTIFLQTKKGSINL